MQRRFLFKILLLIVSTVTVLMAAGCSRTQVSLEKDSYNIELKPGQELFKEERLEISSDYDLLVALIIDENLPLNAYADFNTFYIYRIDKEDGDLEKLYSFKKTEAIENGEYFTGYGFVGQPKDLSAAVYFKLYEDLSGTQKILLLNKVDGIYKELFYEEYYDDTIEFADIDKDGVSEVILGSSNGGGYVSWWSGFSIVYKRNNDTYEQSLELTQNYYLNKAKESEDAFNENKTHLNLKKLIDTYVQIGDEDKAESLVNGYPELISKINEETEVESDKPYSEFVIYQANNYKLYWQEIFPEHYLDETGSNTVEEYDEAAYISKVRSLGDNEGIVVNIREDINLDGKVETIIGTGDEYSLNGLYILRQGDSGIEQLGENLNHWGYMINNVELVKWQDKQQRYIYCSLTNGASMEGFVIYELVGDNPEIFAYSASATGAGSDSIMDRDNDGQYDGYSQLRWSYDVLYISTYNTYHWENNKFLHVSTDYTLPEYPNDIRSVVEQYLVLSALDDGSSHLIRERLDKLCTAKSPQVIEDVYNIAYYAVLYFEDFVSLEIDEKDKEADVTLTYNNEKGTTHIYKMRLAMSDGKWHIDKFLD